ncbi:MAG TPA: hypothetical protein DHV30_07300 [Balneola sp.]|nr:hypothetical protein [Balneola sp.]
MTTIFGVILLFQSVFQLSQPEIVRSNGLNFEKIATEEYAVSLFQDSRKLLWIGTVYGVNVYDGYSLESFTYNLADSLGFKGTFVSTIAEDKFGRIWVAADKGGINIIENGKSFLLDPNNSNWDSRAERTFWVGSHKDFMWVISEDKITRIKVSKNLYDLEVIEIDNTYTNPERPIHAEIIDKGEIYFLSGSLYKMWYSKEEGIKVQNVSDITDQNDIHITDTNEVLIPSNEKIIIVKEDQVVSHIVPLLNENQQIRRVYKDSKGIYWLGLNDGILELELNKELQILSQKFYEASNSEAILEDSFGNIFFASDPGSILKLNSGYDQFEYIQLPDGETKNYVHKFLEDDDGNYWIAGFGLLLKYDTETGKFYQNESGYKILNTSIFNLIKDDKGFIWVGSLNGLTRIDPTSMEKMHWDTQNIYEYEELISFKGVYHFKKDKNGDIWFIVGSRLGKIDTETLELSLFEEIGGEVKDIDKFLIDDSGDRIWVWKKEHRLEYYEMEGEALEWNKEAYLDLDFRRGIGNIIELENGQLWIGYEQGILVFDKETKILTAHLDDPEFAPKIRINELVKDKNGYVWIDKGARGSIAIDPDNMTTVFELPNWLYNPMNSEYASVKTISESGRIFTDGHGGFFTFFSDQLMNNRFTPSIVLKEVRVNQNRIDSIWNRNMVNGITMNYNENDIEFDVTAIHFNDPSRNEYSYYMEGIDNDWSENTLQRSVIYLSLPPGEYSFYVKASNNDGVWSQPVELASFRILAPWWANPIAYFMYICVLGFIGFRFYKSKLVRDMAESEAKRLKEVDEFKTRFFTNISHEFRTPLTVINGLAGRLPEATGIVIKRNSQKLLGLINQILELSKLESSNAKLKLVQSDILKYLSYLLQSYYSYAKENQVSIYFESDHDEIIMDYDQDKLDLIFQNLISNAIKFTPKGGTINVFVTRESRKLNIKLSDTGRGIEEKAISKIFDRFYQAETTHSNHQGSGIGLSLTKEIVHLMDGEISVESILGVGTTFTINIPITNNAARIIINEEVTDQELKNISSNSAIESREIANTDKNVVLLVEDNTDVRDFVYSIISEEFEVITAIDGNDGLEKARKFIPDIIVSDVMMPVKDGIELTDELKNDKATSHIPIILLTAKADVESRLFGLKSGADIYLSKPFNESELMIHLQNLLAQRERIRAKYNEGFEVEKMEDEFIIKLRALLLDHLSDELFGIEHICKEMGVSRTQLHRKLKALTNKSTSIFIRDIRLIEAQKLIKKTNYTISEIAYKVGFGDPNYFSKLYSEKFNYSPSKERETSS